MNPRYSSIAIGADRLALKLLTAREGTDAEQHSQGREGGGLARGVTRTHDPVAHEPTGINQGRGGGSSYYSSTEPGPY